MAYQKIVKDGCLVLTLVEWRKDAPDVEISATFRCTEHQLFDSAGNLHCFFSRLKQASAHGSGRMPGAKGQGLGRANSLRSKLIPVGQMLSFCPYQDLISRDNRRLLALRGHEGSYVSVRQL